MIKKISILTTVFCLVFSVCLFAQGNKNAEKQIDALFSTYNSNTPGAAVAVLKDGKIIFSKGYGMADLDHSIPITTQTVFNIASVSKQFTAFAIYLLASEGSITLEDDIRKYIPELPGYGATIRIRHLLAHTSGLRDQAAILSLAGWRSGDVQTTEQIMGLMVRQKSLNFSPGTMFSYSNTGYTLLAEIIHHVTGKSFAAYADEKIFRPLGMTSTQVYDNYERVVKNKAESYERNDTLYLRKPLNVSNAGPSNVLTTVEDLCKWVMNFEKPVVGNAQLIRSFNEVSYLDDGRKVVLRVVNGDTIFHAKGQNISYYKGIKMISHGGHAAAFRTYMGRFPDQHFAIIALSNDEHNEDLRARWQIADFFMRDHMKEEKKSSVTTQPTGAAEITNYISGPEVFAGEYYNDEIEARYAFEKRGDKLVMKHLRSGSIDLNRVGENKFSGSGPHTFLFELEFLRDKNGVTNFQISNFGVKNLKFVKLK